MGRHHHMGGALLPQANLEIGQLEFELGELVLAHHVENLLDVVEGHQWRQA